MEVNNFCLADEFIKIKNMINTEINRRNYTDLDKLYNKYNSNTTMGKYSIVPKQYEPILTEHIDKIMEPIEAIHSQPTIADDDYIYALKTLEGIITAYQTDERHTGANAIHCQSSCIGMCVGCTSCTSCTGCEGCTSCTGTCSGTCRGCSGCSSCSGTCSGGCSRQCAQPCIGACSSACSGGAAGWD